MEPTAPDIGLDSDLAPGQRFLPLDEAVADAAAYAKQVGALKGAQRAAHRSFAGYRDGWVTVLDDRAGDGYFYDPARRDRPGHFFYHFAEDGHYEFYPSLRNFLAALIECYESDAYGDAAPAFAPGLKGDYEKADAIQSKYAAANPR